MTALSRLLVEPRTPKKAVAWQGDNLLQWGDFQLAVAKTAALLSHRSERSWLLALDDPWDFAVGLFALWHSGKHVVLPPSMRTGVLNELSARVDAVLDVLPHTCDGDAAFEFAPISSTACLDIYTSGSTGEPKRVKKTLRQLETELIVLDQLWDDAETPVLSSVPHHHIYGLLFRLLRPLSAAQPFDTETYAAPEILLARLEKIGAGVLVSSPSQLTRMHELIPLEKLRGRLSRIISSGGPLSAETAARFRNALGQAPLEILGSTETGGMAWRIQEENDDAWTVFPGVRIWFEDEALTLTSPFLPNSQPLSTGDAGIPLADGRFIHTGRRDRIVKIEEKRLSLADLEARLRQYPGVSDTAVLVLPGPRRTRLAAAVVLDSCGSVKLSEIGRRRMAEDLRAHLGNWFDAVLLPRVWRYPESLPYNERGKLAITDLAHLFEEDVPEYA